MTEHLDIINENDEVIGKDTFENVHANKQLHRFTRILVQNAQNDFVLHRRYWNGKKEIRLDSAGGHVRSGETYNEGARRELREEMGITGMLTELGKIECHITNPKQGKWEGMLGRLFTTVHNGPYSHDDEVIDFTTMTVEDAFSIATNAPNQMTPQLVDALKLFQHTHPTEQPKAEEPTE